ncbi:MAG: hypothetical protein E7595_06715 [Ruminococcaceae bacterium]|nr:hypothetical protein [Oscillospiraceae bacterium]
MGFGVALLGYACLLLIGVGGTFFAVPLLAYGFFLASRLESGFMKASVTSLFILPRGILELLTLFGIIKPETSAVYPIINTATFYVFLAAWALMTYFWLTAVANIAHTNSADKLERQAKNRIVFTEAMLMLMLVTNLLMTTNLLGSFEGMAGALQFILQYAVLFVNLFFLHTCFVMITSKSQYEKDKQQLAKEKAAATEKLHKEREEAARKLAERNKSKDKRK